MHYLVFAFLKACGYFAYDFRASFTDPMYIATMLATAVTLMHPPVARVLMLLVSPPMDWLFLDEAGEKMKSDKRMEVLGGGANVNTSAGVSPDDLRFSDVIRSSRQRAQPSLGTKSPAATQPANFPKAVL
mmetsp:Transcript_34336/g.63686  ORF Transcript_34336/g.63686 Transcript_34336/m.63686 type:complete len:130 (-) Transcript_34336:177-566(-)